jgi:hypothetical protein
LSFCPSFRITLGGYDATVQAHSYSASAYGETLLHVGLRIAQILNLHLLGVERVEDGRTRTGLIRRELGRRIWLILRMAEGWVVQPSLPVENCRRPDFVRPGALRLPQGVTVEPFNAHDVDLTDDSVIERPLTEPTVMMQ